MARTKSKKITAECCPPAMVDYQPSLHLDLEGADVKQLDGLKVGEDVEVLVRGKVKSLEQRQYKRMDEKGKEKEVTSGHISVEGYKIQVLEEESNAFSKLAEEDD
jgi:hypothetical protein